LTFKDLEHVQLILSWQRMLRWMVNKYAQFVNNLFIVVLQRMLYKTVKYNCELVKLFVYETLMGEVI